MIKPNDFKILRYIHKKQKVSHSELLKKFKCNSLDELYIRYNRFSKYAQPADDFIEITPEGNIFFEDWNTKNGIKRLKKIENILFEITRSIIFPLIVSFVTTLLTLYLNQCLK